MKLLTFILFSLVLSERTLAENLQSNYSFRGRHYQIRYQLLQGYQEITLGGSILSGAVENLEGIKQVRKLLRPNVDIRLVLNSGGGYMVQFNRFFRALKRNCDSATSNCRITSVVPSYNHCASACVPFFMVGDVRRAGRFARFGLHSASVVPGAGRIPRMAQQDLISKGVDADWVNTNKRFFDSLEMSWLAPHQLTGSNIVTEIAN